jgi:hypothetical protein
MEGMKIKYAAIPNAEMMNRMAAGMVIKRKIINRGLENSCPGSPGLTKLAITEKRAAIYTSLVRWRLSSSLSKKLRKILYFDSLIGMSHGFYQHIVCLHEPRISMRGSDQKLFITHSAEFLE